MEIVLANHATEILNYTDKVINCHIHTTKRTRRLLKDAGASVLGMDDILNAPVDGSGFNS